MNPDSSDPDPRKGGNGPGDLHFNFRNNKYGVFLALILGSFFLVFLLSNADSGGTLIPYSDFLSHLSSGRIADVSILDQSEIRGTLQERNGEAALFRTRIPYFDEDLVDQLNAQGVRFSGEPRPVSPLRVMLELLPWGLALFIIWFMYRQMQGGTGKAFSFGKSKAKRVPENAPRIGFSDVAGQKEAKYELEEVVEFLKNPAKFTRIGAKIPKGVLLVGMPGTGKTLLAKACAGEAGVPFFHMSGSDFVEMFVGVGASRVRDLFEEGRKNAPCILFIDELDAVGRTRGAGMGGGHDEREQTLNQMLVEMDGFNTQDGIIVIAATNRPDVLDPALLRPGRFDRQVVVDMPDMNERAEILAIHSAKVHLADDVDLKRVARATPGVSGADLANLVNEAALYAARKGKAKVELEDFEEARDKMLMGVARTSKVISEKDRLATAYHEAGHALLHYLLPNADPLHKVTVVPRGRALGVAISLPEEDAYSRGRGWLLDRIKIAYGGYVAETLVYSETTTGTQNDLKQATELARKMVCDWGMSDLGPVAYGQEDEPIFVGMELGKHRDYSEETSRLIDEEVSKILRVCLQDAEALLREHRDDLEKLANGLVREETLSDEEVRKLLDLQSPASSDDEGA